MLHAEAYVFQSGTFKYLTVRWRNSSLLRKYGSNSSFDENRLIIRHPDLIL
ncbi:outer membrane porin, OprD family [Pseudomonas sp. RIT412]|nr:outer membrane porin, OprD family [Pseudomonas sp. RIT 409]RAU55362.1 outer membrane porin, OprD family [Pseudomonas sp. RIT 412]